MFAARAVARAASALERAGKRSFAVLRLWARAKAIPGEARLALNRLPTCCTRHYYLDGVLARIPDDRRTNAPRVGRRGDAIVALVPQYDLHVSIIPLQAFCRMS